MKPDGPVFDSEWRKHCTVRACSITEIDAFIKAHYLGKRPAVCLLCLVAERDGTPFGCITYSAPPREIEKRYGGTTWELSRLYLLDWIPKNAETWLVAKSIRHLRHYFPEVAYLVSYADPSVGHRGVVYLAGGWRQDGRTDEGRKTPRCDYCDATTGKKYGRRGNMPADAVVVRVPRTSKWRFFMPLGRGK